MVLNPSLRIRLSLGHGGLQGDIGAAVFRGGTFVQNQFADFFTGMLFGNQDVNAGDDEQSKNRADGHAGHDGNADRVARGSSRAAHQRQREMAANGGDTGHEDRPESHQRGFARGLKPAQALPLQSIGKFDDENAVFGHQAYERDQADL